MGRGSTARDARYKLVRKDDEPSQRRCCTCRVDAVLSAEMRMRSEHVFRGDHSLAVPAGPEDWGKLKVFA